MYGNIKNHIKGVKPEDRFQQIITHLYTIRGLKTKKAITNFLSPPHPNQLTLTDAGLSQSTINQALARITTAIATHQTIVIYGDYDADGITATAILWLTLHQLGAKVHPFIPHREHHGYGLSVKGATDLIDSFHPDLIITVDNGIVAHQAAKFVHSQNIDLIITDHHQPGKTLPPATTIIHSDQIAGSGVAWFLASQLINLSKPASFTPDSLLDLLTIGTLADMMPMIGVNRSLVKHGLNTLSTTTRPGLTALKQEAGITASQTLSTYHIGYIIAPRINAMGRLEHGLDALRLLCTKNPTQAKALATTLGETNKTRQDLTLELLEQAELIYQDSTDQTANIIIIDHPEFHEGIIGLIAGRLAEKYHKPTIVISRGKQDSKASARSVDGVNIIKLIRTHQHLLLGAGGHPGAAGFNIRTSAIDTFRQAITQTASSIPSNLLTKRLHIDCRLALADMSIELYRQITAFEPFGIGNPRPTFAAPAQLLDFRSVGNQHQHLKLTVKDPHSPSQFDAIAFHQGSLAAQLSPNSQVEIAFNLDENTWNGRTKLQLLINDISLPSS